MPIIYAGAYEHEAAISLSSADITKFDPDYAPYALHLFPCMDGPVVAAPAQVWLGYSPVPLPAPTFVNWLHFRCVREGATSGTASSHVIMQAFGVGGVLLFNIVRETNHIGGWGLRVNGQTGPGAHLLPNVNGYFPDGQSVTFDIRLTQNGVNHIVDLFVNGILQGTATRANVVQVQLDVVRFTAIPSNTIGQFDLYLSEMIMTDAEPTIGSRLASQRPTGVAEINTWAGTWASLADDDTGSGISTDVVGSRIAGQFETYNGTPTPVGIRAVVQANYYVDNASGLLISSFLRNAGVNDDTFDFEARDLSRVFTVWDDNPFTSAFWTVANLAAVRGGVRSRV